MMAEARAVCQLCDRTGSPQRFNPSVLMHRFNDLICQLPANVAQ